MFTIKKASSKAMRFKYKRNKKQGFTREFLHFIRTCNRTKGFYCPVTYSTLHAYRLAVSLGFIQIKNLQVMTVQMIEHTGRQVCYIVEYHGVK